MVKAMMTGSRDITDRDWPVIGNAIQDELIEQRPDEFFFGGAQGADSVALSNASIFRKEDEIDVTLTVVVPWTLEDQPAKVIPVIKDCADRIVELEVDVPIGRAAGYHARNEWMIERADRCRVFWNGQQGGTQSTAEKARDAGLHIRLHELGQLGREEAKANLM